LWSGLWVELGLALPIDGVTFQSTLVFCNDDDDSDDDDDDNDNYDNDDDSDGDGNDDDSDDDSDDDNDGDSDNNNDDTDSDDDDDDYSDNNDDDVDNIIDSDDDDDVYLRWISSKVTTTYHYYHCILSSYTNDYHATVYDKFLRINKRKTLNNRLFKIIKDYDKERQINKGISAAISVLSIELTASCN
jgi:hypothetical protein